MEHHSPDDQSKEQDSSIPKPSTDMPDSHLNPPADQDMNINEESTTSVEPFPKEDEVLAKDQRSDLEEMSDSVEGQKAHQQPGIEIAEGRPSVSDNSLASNSAASTPFGTPENRDHPLPDLSVDNRPEESPNILSNLRSSPTPRTINLPDITTTAPKGPSNSTVISSIFAAHRHEPDSPTSDLVNSLKAQLDALSEQRDMLNQKLVTSFSRMADLEDDLFQIRDTADAQKRQINELEQERKEHLHALDTGLLVEQSNVKQEMQRLAASLMDEQGKRDLAEEGKHQVESEVDDLAASLFQQANSMVAAERLARSRAEARLVTAEENLTVAESVVREMQSAMQALSHSSETSIQDNNLCPAMNHRPIRNDHIPYAEFLAFVTHLRSMRPRGQSSTPPFSSLLQFINMPFFARMITEDHEPALRLDFAPGVSWLNKKSISQAVIDSMLIVEPVSAAQIFSQKPEGDIICALSGELISPASANPLLQNVEPPASSLYSPQTRGLSFFNRSAAARPSSAMHRPELSRPGSTLSASHPPIYVFHIAPAVAQSPLEKPTSLYPVAEGWSLDRLRATCELWRFIKTGIMSAVWSYEDGTTPTNPPKLPARSDRISQPQPVQAKATETAKPVLPVRKSSSWGLNLGFGKSSGSSSGGWGISRSQPETPKQDNLVKGRTEARELPTRRLPPPFDPAEVEDQVGGENTARADLDQPDQSLVDESISSSINEAKPQIDELSSAEPVVESISQGDENQDGSSETRPEEPTSALSEVESTTNDESAEVVKLPSAHVDRTSVDRIEVSSEEVDRAATADKPPVEKEVEESFSARTSLEQINSNRTSLEQPPERQPTAAVASPAPPLPKRAAARRAVPPVPTPTAVSEAGTRPTTPVSASVDNSKKALPIETSLSAQIASNELSKPSDSIDAPNLPNQSSDVSLPDTNPVSTSTVTLLPEEGPKEENSGVDTSVFASPLSSVDTEKKAAAEKSAPVEEDNWEEKTWKELVKLREDLFWKRIGVRSNEN